MDLFDANAYIGRYRQMGPGAVWSREELIADMNRFGIAEALVCDTASREVHCEPGNRRILELTSGQPRLHPCWSLIPARTGEIGPLETLLDRMREAGVRAVKLFPGHYTFGLNEWCVGDLLETLEKGRIPTFIDPNREFIGGWPPDSTDWDAIVTLCKALPRLPVIVSESRFRSANRMIYQALHACPNLHIELSGFWVHHGIEFICREFGANRLLFGSKWPIRDVGGLVATVRMADISDKEKALIGGDNLRELLARAHKGRMRKTAAHRVRLSAPTGGSVRSKALRGEPPEGDLIIDAHAHLGRAAIYHLADSTPALVVKEMERLNVQCSIVFGLSGVIGDWTCDNDLVAKAMKDHPDRYYGLIVVNPNAPEQMMAELERCENKGFIGVKLIAQYQGYPEEGPNIDLALAWANERKMIVLNHGWGSVGRLRDVAERFSDTTLIVGHYSTAYAPVVNNYPNVYQCTCEPLMYDSVETLVKVIDPAKIVYGSDVTDLPIPLGMGPILHARIAEDDKKRILGLNALGMLRRAGVEPLPGGDWPEPVQREGR